MLRIQNKSNSIGMLICTDNNSDSSLNNEKAEFTVMHLQCKSMVQSSAPGQIATNV